MNYFVATFLLVSALLVVGIGCPWAPVRCKFFHRTLYRTSPIETMFVPVLKDTSHGQCLLTWLRSHPSRRIPSWQELAAGCR